MAASTTSTSTSVSRTSTPKNNRKKLDIPSFDELYELGHRLSFNLIFVDLQKVVCDALRSIFPVSSMRENEIKVIQCKLEDYLESNNIDCIVSSSNAFGLMDHGFDRSVCAVLSDKNNEIKTRIQQQIISKYDGEQPVGTCIIIETTNHKIKYLAHAPSRRVNYSIKGTDNIYLTMKAICHEISLFDNSGDHQYEIKNVLLTGLGTFYGAVSPEESARQTALGWLLARIPKPNINDINWDYAKIRQELIGYGGFNHFIQYIAQNENALTKSQQNRLARSLPKHVITKLHREYRDNNHEQKNSEKNDEENKMMRNNKSQKIKKNGCFIM